MHNYQVIKPFGGKLWLLISMVLLMSACTKKDILPEPVGNPVPYTDSVTKTWQQIMDKPAYTFFKAAFAHSGMTEIMKNSSAQYHTIFMATDAAFANAGWTMDAINAAPAEVLDSLLSYHIVEGSFKPANISGINGSVPLTTMLGSSTVYATGNFYTYKLFAGHTADSLLIDGIGAAKWNTGEAAINGYVYPIERLLQKPEITTLQYLENDPRFTFLMYAIQLSEAAYQDNSSGIEYHTLLGGFPGIDFTFFAPTNKAFQNIGLNTMDDIKAYVDRTLPLPYPDLDANLYYINPLTTIDSLLVPLGLETFNSAANSYYPISLCFFTNDILQNGAALSGMVLKQGSIYNSPPVKISLRLSNQNGKPMIGQLGSAKPLTPLAQTNIRTLNGVVHVLDEGIPLRY